VSRILCQGAFSNGATSLISGAAGRARSILTWRNRAAVSRPDRQLISINAPGSPLRQGAKRNFGGK
jgi:hypothetical protein